MKRNLLFFIFIIIFFPKNTFGCDCIAERNFCDLITSYQERLINISMKYLKCQYLILLVILIIGCSKKSSLGNLEGSWTFGSYFINGLGGNAEGIIIFEEDNPCTVDIWYEITQDSIANDTIFLQGEFSFIQNENLLTINLDSETLDWDRVVNEKDEQEFHFKKVHKGIEYDIVFDLIPE